MARKPTPKDLEELRNSLVSARRVLSGGSHRLEAAALESNGAPAAADGDTGAHHQSFNLDLLERNDTTLREVEDALDRIEAGIYGRCERCEAWIPKSRLRVVPHARNCIACQRDLETLG